MKILHVLSGFYPTRGGVETLIESLSIELSESEKVDSIFIAPRSWRSRPDDLVYKGYRTYSIDLPVHSDQNNLSNLKGARAAIKSLEIFEKILKEERPDLIHIHGVFELFIIATTLAKKHRVPTIHHIHGELPLYLESNKLKLLEESSCIVTVSEKVAQSVKELIPDSKPLVIPNGVKDFGARNSITSVDVFTFVGRLEEQKGLHVGLLALASILQKKANLRINVVGIGNHIFFHKLSMDLGISQNIFFYGACSHLVTLKILKETDLVFVPSTSTEGFSMVAAEANLMAIPVVASDVGGLPQTILDGKTGIIFSAGDVSKLCQAIEYYLDNPLVASSHGKHGRARALLEFSILKFAQNIYNLYVLEVNRQSFIGRSGEHELSN